MGRRGPRAMSKLALIASAASLLALSCGGAPPADKAASPTPSRERPDPSDPGAVAAGTGEGEKAPAAKPAGGFSTYTDPTYGFQVDFFGKPERGEPQTVNGPKGTATVYIVDAK